MEEPRLIKKTSLTEAVIKKQKQVLIIAVICVITLFIGTSYALLTNFDKTDNVVTFKTGNLNMTVNNTAGLINLNNKLPENDADGLQNATPVVLTLTNTGSIDIMKYDVKLAKENSTTNVSTLEDKYIKYAISTDGGVSYSSGRNLATDKNIIFTGYNLAVDASKTIYLKVWIDEAAGNNAINKTYYGSITVDLYQKSALPLVEEMKTKVNSTNSVTEDGIIYLSGTNETVSNNYVWYSGKLWRITAIYPDGTMKMITDDAITTISYGSDVNFYTDESNTSYMYQWLNEDFLDTLYNYENIIVTDSKWNATNSNATSTNEISTKLPETTMVTAPVGLMNSYEYYMSYKNTSAGSGYLNIGYWWWLLNPYSSSNVWILNNGGGAVNSNPSDARGIRPSVNLKSTIQLLSGTGTKSDPYRISGDKEEATANTTLLSTRTSGEYVSFDGELYRIVSIEEGKTKINKNDYVRDESNVVLTKKYSNNTTWGSGTSTDEYWDYYLPNTWYNGISVSYKNMLVEGTYYLGTTSNSYKGAICKVASNTVATKDCEKTASIWSGFVGLPRVGEMFANQQGSGYSTSSNMWLMNPYSSSSMWDASYYGNAYSSNPSDSRAARPSMYLKSAVKITGGKGIKENPFQISL